MEVLVIPILVVLCVAIATTLGLHLLISKISPYLLRVLRIEAIRAWAFLRMPVNPVTRLVTSRKRIAKYARLANREHDFSYDRVTRYKEISFWPAIALIALLFKTSPPDQVVLLGIVLVGLAWFWPELYLARLAVRFEREAEKGLLHIIDLLRLHVSAGQNLDGALRSVAKTTGGLWGFELSRVVGRLDVGMGFDDALAISAERFGLSDLNRFLAALKQSRQLGASLAATLAIQGALLRSRRKQRAEEHARSASVKIAVPLVTCIFPALLVIYLAPAVLRIAGGL